MWHLPCTCVSPSQRLQRVAHLLGQAPAIGAGVALREVVVARVHAAVRKQHSALGVLRHLQGGGAGGVGVGKGGVGEVAEGCVTVGMCTGAVERTPSHMFSPADLLHPPTWNQKSCLYFLPEKGLMSPYHKSQLKVPTGEVVVEDHRKCGRV